MKTLILLFHPNLSQSKVNQQLAKAAEQVDNVTVRNMYSIYPNFEIDIDEEQRILAEADRIVLQFPMYWYSSPSLLKQWEDTVLTHGWAYGTNGNHLEGKDLLIAVTPGATEDNYVHGDRFRYTVTDLLRPFQATNNLIQTRFVKPFIVYGASSIDDESLEKISRDYAKYVVDISLDELGDYE